MSAANGVLLAYGNALPMRRQCLADQQQYPQ
jgi:hypothetical protein